MTSTDLSLNFLCARCLLLVVKEESFGAYYEHISCLFFPIPEVGFLFCYIQIMEFSWRSYLVYWSNCTFFARHYWWWMHGITWQQ